MTNLRRESTSGSRRGLTTGVFARLVVLILPSLVLVPVAITGAPASSAQGTQILLGSTITDPGTLDTFSYTWSVTKNDQPVNLAGVPTTQATFAFTPLEPGSYVVTLAVTDKDGATTLFQASSGDCGMSWSDNRPVTARACRCCRPAVVSGGEHVTDAYRTASRDRSDLALAISRD